MFSVGIHQDKEKVRQLTDTKTVTYTSDTPPFQLDPLSLARCEYNPNHALWLCYSSALAYQAPSIMETVVRDIWGMYLIIIAHYTFGHKGNTRNFNIRESSLNEERYYSLFAFEGILVSNILFYRMVGL